MGNKQRFSEKVFMDILCKGIKNEDTKKLLESILNYYEESKEKHKKRYFKLRIVSIVVSGIITVLSAFAYKCEIINYILPLFAATSTTLISLEGLLNSKDTWLQCSGTYEATKIEIMKYAYHIDEYVQGTSNADEILIGRIIGICGKRVNHFVKFMDEEKDQKKN